MNRGTSQATDVQASTTNLLALIPAHHASVLDRVAAESHLARSVRAAARALSCETEHADDVAMALSSRGPRPALVINPLHAAMHVEVVHSALNRLLVPIADPSDVRI